mmetsp:Transcript_16355/g.41688  ORF Transcript_16355/g.41688 Transcript_16355/m.41688 type:complete len:120 (-) Transcript_16355:180-539(-)
MSGDGGKVDDKDQVGDKQVDDGWPEWPKRFRPDPFQPVRLTAKTEEEERFEQRIVKNVLTFMPMIRNAYQLIAYNGGVPDEMPLAFGGGMVQIDQSNDLDDELYRWAMLSLAARDREET